MVKLTRLPVEKLLKSRGVSPDVVDIKAEWDSSLTRGENIGAIGRKYAPKIDFIKEQYQTTLVKRSNRQTGKSNIRLDRKRSALPPGLRETWYGRKYSERRKNRSDLRNRV